MQIKDKSVQALVDSGASRSVVSADFVKRMQIPYQNLQDDESLNVTVADGRSVTVLGKAEFCVRSMVYQCRVKFWFYNKLATV